jgi:dolichyl-phosphate beta-glucosyltransferase
MKTISIVLPVQTAQRGLRSTVRRLCRQARRLPFPAEVVVVAPAGTEPARPGDDAGGAFVSLRVFSSAPGDAHANPAKLGVLRSAGDYVLVLNESASVPLGELSRLLPHFERGAHVVIGSRYLGPAARRSLPWRLRAGHALVSFVANQLLLGGIRDAGSGFTCFVGPVARQLYAMEHMPARATELEVLARARRLGYVLVEVPVRWHPLPERATDRLRAAGGFLINLLRIRWRTGRPRRRMVEQPT